MPKITTQQWKPDTCRCIVDQEVNHDEKDEKGNSQITQTHIIPCDFHAVRLSTIDSVYTEQIHGENIRKNKAFEIPWKLLGETKENAVRLRWRFDENRNLIIGLPLALQERKQEIKTELSKISEKVDVE